jgi:putative glutamine amidotransferase
MARPIIGICTPLERARWGAWDQDAFLLPRSYVDAVHRAGAMALLLAPDPALVEEPDEVLDHIDGLMLAGGADIDPTAYGGEPHPATIGSVPERDAFEVALVRRALERDIPLLGICRGMQVMNIARGGTLHQHLPELVGHDHHRRVLGSFDGADHEVRLTPGSLAARAAGEELHATKTRASTASAGVSSSRGGPTSTSCRRHSRWRATASRSACNGIPRPTSAAGSSPLSWRRHAPDATARAELGPVQGPTYTRACPNTTPWIRRSRPPR